MRLGALLAALLLVGSLQLTHDASTPSLSPTPVEVPFGAQASGATVGANATNASASIVGAVVLASTQDLFWLNNTNATGAYWVRLVATSTSDLGTVTTLALGVDNGTATDQVVVANGALTQPSGAYVRLPPSSSNRVYATTLVPLVFGTGALAFDAYVADDEAESAYYVMRGSVTVT